MEAINFTDEALEDLKFWQKSGNTIILKRIRQLVQAIKLIRLLELVNLKH